MNLAMSTSSRVGRLNRSSQLGIIPRDMNFGARNNSNSRTAIATNFHENVLNGSGKSSPKSTFVRSTYARKSKTPPRKNNKKYKSPTRFRFWRITRR